jgi:hypothetical protein
MCIMFVVPQYSCVDVDSGCSSSFQKECKASIIHEDPSSSTSSEDSLPTPTAPTATLPFQQGNAAPTLTMPHEQDDVGPCEASYVQMRDSSVFAEFWHGCESSMIVTPLQVLKTNAILRGGS